MTWPLLELSAEAEEGDPEMAAGSGGLWGAGTVSPLLPSPYSWSATMVESGLGGCQGSGLYCLGVGQRDWWGLHLALGVLIDAGLYAGVGR